MDKKSLMIWAVMMIVFHPAASQSEDTESPEQASDSWDNEQVEQEMRSNPGSVPSKKLNEWSQRNSISMTFSDGAGIQSFRKDDQGRITLMTKGERPTTLALHALNAKLDVLPSGEVRFANRDEVSGEVKAATAKDRIDVSGYIKTSTAGPPQKEESYGLSGVLTVDGRQVFLTGKNDVVTTKGDEVAIKGEGGEISRSGKPIAAFNSGSDLAKGAEISFLPKGELLKRGEYVAYKDPVGREASFAVRTDDQNPGGVFMTNTDCGSAGNCILRWDTKTLIMGGKMSKTQVDVFDPSIQLVSVEKKGEDSFNVRYWTGGLRSAGEVFIASNGITTIGAPPPFRIDAGFTEYPNPWGANPGSQQLERAAQPAQRFGLSIAPDSPGSVSLTEVSSSARFPPPPDGSVGSTFFPEQPIGRLYDPLRVPSAPAEPDAQVASPKITTVGGASYRYDEAAEGWRLVGPSGEAPAPSYTYNPRTTSIYQQNAFVRGSPVGEKAIVDLGDLTSGFGIRPDPFLNVPSMHTGMDFRGNTGDPIRATGSGEVTVAGANGGYGKMVEINHGDGTSTRYAHMSSVAVWPGDTVRGGEILGRVGSTGRSTGPHLHYETLVNGEVVDPCLSLCAKVPAQR